MKFIDITGKRFGRLVVIGIGVGKIGNNLTWNCKCDCGGKVKTCSSNLKSGHTKSCGCFRDDVCHKSKNVVHGMTGSPTFRSWISMNTRCNDPKRIYYGGRGIKVCRFLKESPKNLLSLIGKRPSGQSIDRKYSNGNYSCGQCAECLKKGWSMNIRWATRKEQQRNTRRTRLVTINGKTKCASEWAEKFNLPDYVILQRLNAGWPVENLSKKSRVFNPT